MGKINLFLTSDKAKDIMVVFIVILMGFGAFELGRLSITASSGVKIDYFEQKGENALDIDLFQKPAQKAFFASNKGSKYYPVGCTAGNNIKQENRIYFTSVGEAQGAGYELSVSCR